MFNRHNERRHRFDERQDLQDYPEYSSESRRRYGRNDYGDGWSDEPRWSDESERGGYRREPRREEWNPSMHNERLGEADLRSRTWSSGRGPGQGPSSYAGPWNQGAGRRSVRGVGPHTGKGPKGYTRSDERIREEISDELMADGDIDASEIEVQVSSGEVTLTGTVDSRDAKRRTEELIEQIQGVRDVQNRLRVQNSRDESSLGGTRSSGSSSGTAAARRGSQREAE